MDSAARLIHQAFRGLGPSLEHGASTLAIARGIHDYLIAGGADPGSIIRTSVENVAWHGLPDETALKDGEIITVDVACSVRGWWADSAWTFPVGTVDTDRLNLIRASWEGTASVIRGMKPGEDGKRIHSGLKSICSTYDVGLLAEGAGHGIGCRLHEHPALTYDGRTHEPLAAGRVFTAEPIFTIGKGLVVLSEAGSAVTSDGMPTAHFEATVLVTEHGGKVLGAPDWMDRPPC